MEEERADMAQAATPDRIVNLMFVCAHPAIDARIRTPLMLHLVLGDLMWIALVLLSAEVAAASPQHEPGLPGQARGATREYVLSGVVPDVLLALPGADLPQVPG